MIRSGLLFQIDAIMSGRERNGTGHPSLLLPSCTHHPSPRFSPSLLSPATFFFFFVVISSTSRLSLFFSLDFLSLHSFSTPLLTGHVDHMNYSTSLYYFFWANKCLLCMKSMQQYSVIWLCYVSTIQYIFRGCLHILFISTCSMSFLITNIVFHISWNWFNFIFLFF